MITSKLKCNHMVKGVSMRRTVLLLVCVWCIAVTTAYTQPLPVPYDIIAVRAPRYGDTTGTSWPEVKYPYNSEPGTDLVLLRQDGTEEVLVAGGDGAILDPVLSFDGTKVYYAKIYNVKIVQNNYDAKPPVSGSDIFVMDLATRMETRLTFAEWTPNEGVGHWSSNPVTATPPGTNTIGYQSFNLGPCPLPGNKLMFTSSRNGFQPNKNFTWPNMQLFVMDLATLHVEQVGFLNIGSALHPVVMTSGEVMFSSYESQALRNQRLWGLWAIYPDGRRWRPLMSAFRYPVVFHFHTQLTDGRIAVLDYYNQNNNANGTLLAHRAQLEGRPMADNVAPFGDPNPDHPSNPWVAMGYFPDGRQRWEKFSFSPPELLSLTPFAHHSDRPSDKVNGVWAGKVNHPSAAPNASVLLVYCVGPCNDHDGMEIPAYWGQIALLVGNTPAYWSDQLVIVKSNPAYNYHQPKAVVSYHAIYGIGEPATLPWLPNTGTASPYLPAGTPFGITGTASHMKRNTAPGYDKNWIGQGAEAMMPDNTPAYTDNDIYSVIVIQQEGHTLRTAGPNRGQRSDFWTNPAGEHLRIMGDEIPLRKWHPDGTPVMDTDGHPDTSWAAIIPGDTPFTFATLDVQGRVLNLSQTWHQVRPGEVRTDCGGCHAHAQIGTPFASTYAGQPGYVPHNLTLNPPRDIEWYRDILPLVQRTNPQLATQPVATILSTHVREFQPFRSTLVAQMPGLTDTERREVHLWIGLGAPVNKSADYGWFLDEQRPVLTMVVVPGACQITTTPCTATLGPAKLRVGAYDARLGDRIPVVTMDGQAVTLTPSSDPFIWEAVLPPTGSGVFQATVEDMPGPSGQGNKRRYRLAATW
jgi:hypothetical protein